MKKLMLSTLLLGILLGACKKLEREDYDTKAKDCGSNTRFNGTWLVHSTPKDTFEIYWNGSTFFINQKECNEIKDYAHYTNWLCDTDRSLNVSVSKDDCGITGKGGSLMSKID